MEHIKKIIKSEMSSLNEDEVDIFKKNIEDMFLSLAESISEKQRDTEKSIENSMRSLKSEITIISTIIAINEVKYFSDTFFPLLDEKYKYSNENILNSIKNGEKIILSKLFFDKNPFDTVDKNKIFYGGVVCNGINYDIKLNLVEYQGYRDEIKKLYNYSKNNFLKWNTPNMPFINKFYEVVVIEISEELFNVEEIDDIYFNLEELEGEYVQNLCAVWNIKIVERLNSKDSIYVSEGIHRYKTGLKNTENAILINKNYKIFSLDYDSENILELTTNKKEIKSWDFYFINNSDYNKKYSEGAYPVWTNKKNKNFAYNFSEFFNQRIRSMAEVRRILKSMEGASEFVLKEIYIEDVLENETEFLTYEINDFMISDIRENSKNDLMVLKFDAENRDGFSLDVLSYIVSEIQIYFPEYKCVGELL